MHTRTSRALVSIVLMSFCAVAWSGGFFEHTKKGIAIEAYDPVAYFDQGKPVKGRPEFTTDWGGTTWQFASAAHRDSFKDMPEKYAPQFGGHCAYGVANNADVSGDPKRWRIVDGKLYFNNNPEAHALWLRDVPGNIDQGDQKWPQVKDKIEARNEPDNKAAN